MHNDSSRIFNESFERCSKDSSFLDRFYETFLACSDEVKEKFQGTDMKAQKDVLLISLSYMMMASKQPSMLHKTAIKHNINNRDIKPHLYEYWLDSMLDAVKVTDSLYDITVDRAWREVLQPGINFMIEQHSAT